MSADALAKFLFYILDVCKNVSYNIMIDNIKYLLKNVIISVNYYNLV